MNAKLLATLTASAVLAASGAAYAQSQSGEVQHVAQRGGTSGGHVVVEGNRLYMGMYGAGLRIFDIATPDDPREIGMWMPAESALGPRAVADAPPDAAVLDGRHIAVLNGTGRTSGSLPPGAGRTDNSYFLDVTDPAAPQLLWTFEGAHDGEAHNGDIVDGRRLWLPSGGATDTEGGQTLENGLRIYDLRPLLQSPSAAPELLFRGNPTEMWEQSPYRAGRDVGEPFTHTHDITVYQDLEVAGVKRDIALLAEGGSYTNDAGNTGSMFVIDITNPRAPVVLQRWLHSTDEGHHPIRYHHEAQFLDGDQRVVLVTDEDLHNGCNAGGVTALRLSEDLTSATELSEWFIGSEDPGTFGPVCSVHVFSSHGNLVFFGAYNAGLQVVDYSNPSAPRRVGHNLQPGANSWGAQYLRDGLIYVGDFGPRGLDVFRYTGAVPDLAVLELSIEDRRSDSQRLVATVANQGQLASGAVAFDFRAGDQLVARQTLPALAPGATHRMSAVWDTRGVRGERVLTATADAGDRLDESSEDNNARSLTVRDPGAGDRPSGLRASVAIRRTRLRAAARRGVRVRVTCSGGCRGSVVVRVDRRTARKLRLGRRALAIGRARFTLASAGRKAVRVRVGRRAARALRRARSARLIAVARVTDLSRSQTVTARRASRLRR